MTSGSALNGAFDLARHSSADFLGDLLSQTASFSLSGASTVACSQSLSNNTFQTSLKDSLQATGDLSANPVSEFTDSLLVSSSESLDEDVFLVALERGQCVVVDLVLVWHGGGGQG